MNFFLLYLGIGLGTLAKIEPKYPVFLIWHENCSKTLRLKRFAPTVQTVFLATAVAN
jgi:hypothetical protein